MQSENNIPELPKASRTARSTSKAPKKRSFFRSLLNFMLIFLAGFFSFFLLVFILAFWFLGNVTALFDDVSTSITTKEKINRTVVMKGRMTSRRSIAVIDIKGVILYDGGAKIASASRIATEIKAAIEDQNVVGILLDIDSPGGEVVASDEILHQIKACRSAGKPVVACMRSLAASGAYFIASGCDWIIANRMTFTGSIGVIISSYQMSDLMDKIGVKPAVYRSGNMKDMLSPTREHSNDEKEYVQNLVQSTFTEFCQVIADGREAFASAEDVAAAPFADGRLLKGQDALEMGLVDQLGYFEDAVEKMRNLASAPDAAVLRFSAYQGFWDTFFGVQAVNKLALGNILSNKSFIPETGKPYFLAPEFCL